jgi:hypothetical protein
MINKITDTRIKHKLSSYVLLIDSKDITPRQAVNQIMAKAKDQHSFSAAFILSELYNIDNDIRTNCRKMGMSIGTFM